MRKLNIYLGLFFMMLTFSGCDDFFDLEPLGNSTNETFFDTTYKLQAALNASYDILQSNWYNESDYRFGEACGDDVIGNDEGLSSQMGQLVQFRFTTSNTWIYNRYKINYEGINRVNQVIYNAHRVQLSTSDYSAYMQVREILGQAKFLRALFYFNLVKTYGGVSIRPEQETIDNLVIPRSSREEVYAYIEKDLREAAIMLQARYMNANAGKVGAGAAVALLMKVLMYQAEPASGSSKWQEMVSLGEYFVEGKSMTYGEILKYDSSNEAWEDLRIRLWFKPQTENQPTDPYETESTLLPGLSTAYTLPYADAYGTSIDYWEMFFQNGEFCKGSVLEVVFKESADGTSGDENEGSFLFDDLYSSSPRAWSTSDIVEQIFSSDPRRAATITHQGYSPDGEVCSTPPGTYLSLKWYTPMKERPQYSGDNGKNRRLIRFAEVVLMYAEALNECGFGERALTQLNKTKAEANKINSSSSLYLGGGYGQLRDQIWKERRIELAYEWDRFFDIVRQGRAYEVLRVYGQSRANKRGYYFRKGINEIFPIPQTEIDISNGVVEQNPGY